MSPHYFTSDVYEYTSLFVSSMLAFIMTQYAKSHASSLVFSILLRCSRSSALSCSVAGNIILLPFIVISAMIAILSQNDHYDCSCFCTSAFVNGQSWSTSSNSMPTCSSSSIAILISSPIMHSGMSLHDSIHAWYFFVSVYFVIVSGKPICNE